MPLEEIREHMWSGDVPVRPKWQAVKRYFLEAFRSGQFRSGDVLPSENQLCRAVGVARNTVRQAMAELEKEGIIHRVRGSGTYVSNVQVGMLKETLRAYGLIIPEIRRSLYPSLARGFDCAAGNHHHQTLICNTDYNIDKQGNIILQLIDKRIAGIAIVPPTIQSTPIHHIRQLQSNGVPLVFCHRPVSGVSAPLITWDSEKVGQVAGQTLLEKGHRNILFLGIYRYVLTEAYERGLRKVLQKAGISLPEDHVLYGPPEISEKRDEKMDALVHKALRSPSRPTAIFCSDDNEAERAYWMAQAEGIRVPQDLSIVGFGDTRRDTEFRKRLASVAVDEYALGAKAAEILVAMSSGRLPRDYKNSHLVDVGFVGQATLGPAPS